MNEDVSLNRRVLPMEPTWSGADESHREVGALQRG
jgi:hypothetical protein